VRHESSGEVRPIASSFFLRGGAGSDDVGSDRSQALRHREFGTKPRYGEPLGVGLARFDGCFRFKPFRKSVQDSSQSIASMWQFGGRSTGKSL
jgi:hypothetical protein